MKFFIFDRYFKKWKQYIKAFYKCWCVISETEKGKRGGGRNKKLTQFKITALLLHRLYF